MYIKKYIYIYTHDNIYIHTHVRMIPKHSKKCIHLWNTATNQLESRKFLFILEVLEFFVDFLWCLGWQVANDYGILEYLIYMEYI